MEANFSGYATKSGIRCTDGRIIHAAAFAHQDGITVPLVWQHMHGQPTNILGHAILHKRDDGMYVEGFFNSSEAGEHARIMVEHGDVKALSIYAGDLEEENKFVTHGAIVEVSLVMAGANSGAMIENVNIQHGDSVMTLPDEAIISMELGFDFIAHSAEHQGDHVGTRADAKDKDDSIVHADGDTESTEGAAKSMEEVIETMNDEQKEAFFYLLGKAVDEGIPADSDEDTDAVVDADENADALQHSDDTDNDDEDKDDETEDKDDSDKDDSEDKDEDDKSDSDTSNIQHSKEGTPMGTRNVFDQTKGDAVDAKGVLSHSDIKAIVAEAKQPGQTLKTAFMAHSKVLAHAATYGFEKIDTLFPDATQVGGIEVVSRRMEWVDEVMTGIKRIPFSRVRTIAADITAEEARAKGYVTGNLKKEEVVRLLGRKTGPTTVYKKQKLDRDDILDITTLDVVAWLKAEMRVMLDEEIARAILVGDGRSYLNEDKIDEESIRPIATDDAMYAHPVTILASLDTEQEEEAIIRGRAEYRGSGEPVFFTTLPYLTDLLLRKDKMGRRIYDTQVALAAALMVKKIVTVEVMEEYPDVVGIIVNLRDYSVGTDRGGDVSMFDDFDIDYNQHKYLIETRLSGALTKPKSAIVFKRAATTEVDVQSPSFDGATNTITVPDITGVIYTIGGIEVDAPEVITETTEVVARPAPGYSFPAGTSRNWTYVYSA
jgi:hypothetical protein